MWISSGTDRWSWNADDGQHLLLRDGDLLIELHGTTRHTYRQPAGVAFDPATPLAAAIWVGTEEGVVPMQPEPLTDAQAFELMGADHV